MCSNPVWLIFHHHDLILEKDIKIERLNNLETVYPEVYSEPSPIPAINPFCEIS